MGFVKPKKIWKKKFSNEELEQIWNVFIEATPLSKEEWEKTSLTKFMRKNFQIVHPETDKYDDTEGIQPEQLKSFLEFYSLEDFSKLIVFLNKMASQKDPFLNNFIEDGYVSWEQFFEQIIRPKLNKNDSINFLIGLIYIQHFNNALVNFSIDKDVVEKIGEDYTFIFQIIEVVKFKNLKRKISMKDIDLESFLKERENIWKEVKKIIPKSKYMLLSNPNNFDTKLLPKIEELFGSKQIAKLAEEDQRKASLMINLFGINILSIDSKLLLSEIETLSHLNDYNFIVKDFRAGLSKIQEIVTPSLFGIHNLIVAFSKYPSIYEDIRKKENLTKEDIDLLEYIIGMLNQTRTEKEKEKLFSIEPYFWKIFKRYRVYGVRDILNLIQLFEENKDKNCNIPNIKGKSGSYEYEIIKKDNPIGLILGYATDCCQVIGNNGESCLRRGYDNEDSAFFVVKKKNRIYAQSWVWIKETNQGKKILCFDSIEVLGKDLNKSKSIMAAYKKVAEELIKNHNFDMVIAGADGNSIPEGIENLGQYEDQDFIYDNDLVVPFNNTYTDANQEIIVIKEKKV